MCKNDIDELPQKVQNNEMKVEQALNIIWEDAYTNPYKYGLLYFSEDQKSDFLLGMRKKFRKILTEFNDENYTFTQFLFITISNYKMAFLRNQFEDEKREKSVDYILRAKTEEESQKYEIGLDEMNDEREKNDFEEAKTSDISEVIKKKVAGGKYSREKIAELTTLILMLKACRDVDDETICAVSDFTDIGKDSLYNEIMKMKKVMSRRNDNSLKIVSRRNNAFYFHRKYLQEMISPYVSEEKKEKLREKYLLRTKRWLEINQELFERNNSPSNEEIAKAIGIKPRMVSFYLNIAREEKGLSRIQKILAEKKSVAKKEEESEIEGEE